MTSITTKTQVYCKVDVEGLHHWPNCNINEVEYLKHPHRHMFHIVAYKSVNHDDRDIEFICLKHQIKEWLEEQFFDTTYRMCNFGHHSCESLALMIIKQFDLDCCDVSEDNENGAIVTTVTTE